MSLLKGRIGLLSEQAGRQTAAAQRAGALTFEPMSSERAGTAFCGANTAFSTTLSWSLNSALVIPVAISTILAVYRSRGCSAKEGSHTSR